jgi:hypothetical protein
VAGIGLPPCRSGRPVIMLLQRGEEVPFDIRDFRFVRYDFLPERLIEEQLYVKELVQHIRAIEGSGWNVACPIPGMADAWESSREGAIEVYEQLLMAMTSGSFPQSIINEAKQYLYYGYYPWRTSPNGWLRDDGARRYRAWVRCRGFHHARG